MPSDKLEVFLKEKIEAVQHTLPPGSNWHPEAAWLKLSQNPVPARKKSRNWPYYAAAVLIFGLLLGIIRLYQPDPNSPQTGLATTPTKEILLPTAPAPTLPRKVSENVAAHTKPGSITVPPSPAVATGRKVTFRAEPPAKKLAQNKFKPATAVAVAVNAAPEPETVPANKAVPLSVGSEPATTTPPIKITVVLGAASSAKILNQTANNTPDKKRNKRLRFNLPGSEPAANDFFALTDSAYKFPRLQTRINF